MSWNEEPWKTIFGSALGAGLAFFLTYWGSRWIDGFRRRDKLVRRIPIICADLRDLQIRLCYITDVLGKRIGLVDADHLKWAIALLSRNVSEDLITEQSRQQFQLYLDQPGLLAQRVAAEQKQMAAGIGLHFPPLDAPFLRQYLMEFEGVRPRVVVALRDVTRNLDLLDQHIEQAKYNHGLTYSTTGANHDRASENVERAYREIFKRAKMTCEAIDTAVMRLERALIA